MSKGFPTSERTDRVVVYAMEFAQSRDERPNTIHVLYGLAKESHGVGGHVLNTFCGLTAEAIADEVCDLGGALKVEEPLFDLLDQALAVARPLGHNYIGTEHLLLAILADEKCRGRLFLKYLNQDPYAVEDELMNVLGFTGYTRSYVADDRVFWNLHWEDWRQAEPMLAALTFMRDEKADEVEPGIRLAVQCDEANIGFIIRQAGEDTLPGAGQTSYRKLGDYKVIEVYCQRDQVETVRILVVNFLIAMLSFQ